MLVNTFGNRLQGINYTDRISVYAITFNNDNKVPVVKTPNGYFLLGGGIESNETHKDCLTRECLEEAGLSIEVKEFICKGDIYFWSTKFDYYMHAVGFFYYVELNADVTLPTECDHELLWLNIDDCCNKLFLEHQVWAVKQAFLLKNNLKC
ncbi:MAG: hydrolase, family [Bacillales bacterium]|jgi:8-oxo-dGTP diphosphatase|nr:hydrolase, family [Bacillales bacterium]